MAHRLLRPARGSSPRTAGLRHRPAGRRDQRHPAHPRPVAAAPLLAHAARVANVAADVQVVVADVDRVLGAADLRAVQRHVVPRRPQRGRAPALGVAQSVPSAPPPRQHVDDRRRPPGLLRGRVHRGAAQRDQPPGVGRHQPPGPDVPAVERLHRRRGLTPGLSALAHLDSWVVAAELVAVVALVLTVGWSVVRHIWLNWWGVLFLVGVLLVGIVVPLILEYRARSIATPSVAAAAVLVLAGGFLLRVVMLLSPDTLRLAAD